MPMYEFKCMDCGEVFTVKMSVMEMENTKVTCPKCGSEKVMKMISSFNAMTSKNPKGGKLNECKLNSVDSKGLRTCSN